MKRKSTSEKVVKVPLILVITIIMFITIFLNKEKIEVQINSLEDMVKNYATTEVATYDVSEAGDGSVTATLAEEGVLTISGTGAMKGWSSSSTVPWYSKREQIKEVKIEEGVTSIGYGAFRYCSSLESITIPNTVTSIGTLAFYGCTRLTEVTIPSSVTQLDGSAFAGCTNLINIIIVDENVNYCDDNGILYTKNKDSILKYPEGRTETSFEIPSSVTTIGNYAFYYCQTLTAINIPNSVTRIKYDAFSRCTGLTNIEIPSSVTNIQRLAFYGCTSLTQIEIPNGVTSIEEYVFDDCTSLINVNIGEGVEDIDEKAFYNCTSLMNINVSDGNTNYCDEDGILYTKEKDSIIIYPAGRIETNFKIPNTVKTISSYAFYASNLKVIEIPEGVENIGDSAFCGCINLQEIDIPESVTSIGTYAFSGCEVTKWITDENTIINLPNIIKRVQNQEDTLYSSTGLTLTNCTIENEQIKIDDGKGYGKIYVKDGSLKGLTYYIYYNKWDVSENADKTVIATISGEWELTISGQGSMKSYESASNVPWYAIREKIKKAKIEKGVTSIGNGTFCGCKNLIEVVIPEGVTNIGKWAVQHCERLTQIDLPSSVMSIDGSSFAGCTNLKNIIVSDESISYCDEDGVLYTKDKTKIITYPAGKNEAEYTILSTTTSIGEGAFYKCGNLEKLHILGAVTNIEEWAVAYCTNLKEILIPESVTTIGEDVFEDCNNLIIHCFDGSTAETYAQNNEIGYKIINFNSTELTIDNMNLIIKEVQPETTLKELKAAIESNLEYKLIDLDGNIIEGQTELVGTGYKLKLEGGLSYIIVVRGDLNGDGKAQFSDMVLANKHRLKKKILEGEYLLAGDVTGDGEVDFKDMVQMNKYRLHKSEEI